MTERIKGVLPLAIVIGLLAFLWVEFSLNSNGSPTAPSARPG